LLCFKAGFAYLGHFFIIISALAIAGSRFESFIGSYPISSAPLHDPIKLSPVDTQLYLNIEGEAAQQAYDVMKVDPHENLCGEDHLAKEAGDFSCSFYHKTKKYFCSFSVDINEGKLDSIGSC